HRSVNDAAPRSQRLLRRRHCGIHARTERRGAILVRTSAGARANIRGAGTVAGRTALSRGSTAGSNRRLRDSVAALTECEKAYRAALRVAQGKRPRKSLFRDARAALPRPVRKARRRTDRAACGRATGGG